MPSKPKPSVTNAGKMNKRLQFQTLGGTPNAGGEFTNWVTYATLWGSITDMTGQLLYNTGVFDSKSVYNIVIRYNPAVTISSSDQIVCQGVTFQIEAILNTGFNNRELTIICWVNNQAA
jgi:SPP1 family predicted phage head-tail adaptor